jgi:molybdopterin molybdotransferase
VITVSDALAIITRNTPPNPSETVALDEGRGRVLATDVPADTDWPPFETSAMDGYAVRLSDTASPGSVLIEREKTVAAGDSPPEPILSGEAVRVMTGAPLPPGAEAVIPVEQARREGGRVRFEVAPEPGAHLRHKGESVEAGSRLLRAGRRLTPGDIALAALAGIGRPAVFARPRVTIAVTGDELVAVGDRPRPGQIRDSNGPMLLALCGAGGWPAGPRRRVGDDVSGIEALFDAAGGAEDVLVTSGGVSAGDFDRLPEIARERGFEILFHGVSLRPGKPLVFARRGPTLWFGLPGNPVSSSVCFHLFVRFALGRLEGDASPGAPRVQAELTRGIASAGKRETYRDGILTHSGATLRVEPVATAGSHDIAAHARANVLIRVLAGAEPPAAGAAVECLLL